MRKLSVVALVALACCAPDVCAIELQNIRATYGPFGAKRPDNKILPGDVYLLNFDIAGLVVDAKTGAVQYVMTLEVFDPKGKQSVPEKDAKTEKGVLVPLGGNMVPETAIVVIGYDQPPGKYEVVVTVADKKDAKSTKQIKRSVDVLPKAFGFVNVSAPSHGFVGQDYVSEVGLVGMSRDKKGVPKMTVKTRALDGSGKPLAGDIVNDIPKDMPADLQWDRMEVVPLMPRYFLNRAGTFILEVEATDEIAKKTVKLSYKLTVVDTSK